jgi:hypothetical protein
VRGETHYRPSPAVLEQAYIKDWGQLARSADDDFVCFWEDRAKELVEFAVGVSVGMADGEAVAPHDPGGHKAGHGTGQAAIEGGL